MSNAGQALSSIAGAVIGFFIAGPTGAAWGFQAGMLVGSALFPTQLPHLQGPRLGDGQQTVSTIGAPIPWIFGTQIVGGNVIWASPIREVATTEDVGGKGGAEQSQTTYTYYRSYAILLCEGPITGIRRIWANGKLIYDRSPITEEFEVRGFFGPPVKIALSDALASKMTIYTGTEDQMPDPVIESFEGVGNVPAYRGYAYVVFDDVELKPEDGYRIPASWKFEVCRSGVQQPEKITIYRNEVIYPWTASNNPVHPKNYHTVTVTSVGEGGPLDSFGGTWEGFGKTPLFAALDAIALARNGRDFRVEVGHSVRPNSSDQWWRNNLNVFGGGNAFYEQPYQVAVHFNAWQPTLEPFMWGSNWNITAQFLARGLDAPGKVAFVGNGPFMTINQSTSGAGTYQYWYGSYLDAVSLAASSALYDGAIATGSDPSPGAWLFTRDIILGVTRSPVPPPDPAIDGVPSGIPGWYVMDGTLLPAGSWELVSGTFRSLQKTGTINVGSQPTRINKQLHPLDPVIPVDDPRYNDEEFWTAAYNDAVARGMMEPGLIYGVDYPVTQNFAYKKEIDYSSIDAPPVAIADIVGAICERVGWSLYDVSGIADTYVIGYQISRPMAARAAIDPLRSVGFFDVIESNLELKFVPRGLSPVTTLHEEDLGARLAGEQPPPLIETTKGLELELPQQIRVHYQNPEADFDPGEELSPARVDTDASGVLDFDLPVAITPTQAARIAEVLLRDTWASKWTHTVSVDCSWSELEPADCVLVPVDDSLHRMRIMRCVDKAGGLLRQFELVRDDDSSYVSNAVGSSTHRTPPQLTGVSPAELIFLDLPPLSRQHDNAGFYVAAYPIITGAHYRTVNLAREQDGVWQIVNAIPQPTPVGVLMDVVGTGPSTIIDGASTIIVEMQYGTLESRELVDVLAGANAAAIGADGRWEIVQFMNAELLTKNRWRLSGLLRGRRGTEHAIGKSLPGDKFVLLSAGTLGRVYLDIEKVYVPQSYRYASTGSIAVVDEEFTGNAVALKPFSVVHVTGSRNEDGDLTLEWVRRDRLATGFNVPMSESAEDYEVDILDDVGEVRRTISSSSPSVLYTAAQQLTDFGAVQPSIRVRIYQMSAAVGRGYPTEVTV